MAISAVDVFRIIGTVLDQHLTVSDISSRTITCKDTNDEPSCTAALLVRVQASDYASDPLLRYLIEQSRTLTMDRADEVMDIMVSLYRYSVIDGPMNRLETGDIPDSLFHAPCGVLTTWEDVMDKLKAWVWDNADRCTIHGLEDQLDFILKYWYWQFP